MRKKLTMRYPSGWHGDMWREGAPCGNGKIGALIYGGVMKEHILLNHAHLWNGGKNAPLPDVSNTLPRMRSLLDDKNPLDADLCLTNALEEKGYDGEICNPLPLCDIRIDTQVTDLIDNYSREIDLENASVTVSWEEKSVAFKRTTFVSRSNDTVFTRLVANKQKSINADVFLDLHDTESLDDTEIPDYYSAVKKDILYFAANNKSAYISGDYGAVARIITDGKTVAENKKIKISGASEVLIITRVFVGTDRHTAFAELENQLNRNFDYAEELEKHKMLHKELFDRVDFSLGSDSESSNEELLLNTFTNGISDELLEKLYAYGRYLFICSTADKDTLPCHLLGLWNGTYKSFWGFNMFNVNFQMIYWQALSGNMPELLRLALDYIESLTDDFKENAKKLFGCRGILINSVNTPESGIAKCTAPHILNWTGGAAWVSQHFWDYYQYTEDIEYLKNHALPFMAQTVLFYEDFAVSGADGYLHFYPSVSPENTPQNIFDITQHKREVETTKDAAMEIALLKELLTNLLKGAELTGMYKEKTQCWREMLSKLPPYRINSENAVAEWLDDFYEDNYHHRHHSHLYPLFPGREVTKDHKLYPAFEAAEELRLKHGLSSQSGWSSVYMAMIAARMEKGNRALKMLDAVSRYCLMNNFFALHNDWRRMGPIACDDLRVAPFQIDTNIGIPAAVNEMLVQSFNDEIHILPALPDKWNKGEIKGVLLSGNILCDIVWNERVATVSFKALNNSKKRKMFACSGYVFENGGNFTEIDITDTAEIKIFKKEKNL